VQLLYWHGADINQKNKRRQRQVDWEDDEKTRIETPFIRENI